MCFSSSSHDAEFLDDKIGVNLSFICILHHTIAVGDWSQISGINCMTEPWMTLARLLRKLENSPWNLVQWERLSRKFRIQL